MEFAVDKLKLRLSRKGLCEFMTTHGYAHVFGIPIDGARVEVKNADLERFYTATLPAAVKEFISLLYSIWMK